MSEPGLEDAIRLVQLGGTEAYGQVVRAYHRRLRAWLARLCPPGLDPDEIAQLAFITAYREIGRYRAGTHFFAWLATIARNLLLEEYKRVKREERHRKDYLAAELADAFASDAAEEPAAGERRVQALRDCTALLREELRELLRGRYAENAPLDALSKRLGTSVGAVKVRLFAVRKRLRDCVNRRLRGDS